MLGPVFRTYEPARDRLVAVKVFLIDLLPEQARALADELQGLVEIGLDHPSIVMPLSAGLEGHTVYLAQEYVAAESLDVALRHLAPAPLRRALPLLGQVAGALDFARARGVGHGALHPRDVFVGPEVTKATGFGIVQALERLGVRPPVRRSYSAPERAAGGAWSTPADAYALAAVACELLTGRRPAGASDATPIPGAGPYTNQVRSVLRRALAEEVEARYQDPQTFVDALDAASRGEDEETRELAVELDQDAERFEAPGAFDRNLAEEEGAHGGAVDRVEPVVPATVPDAMAAKAAVEEPVAAETPVEDTVAAAPVVEEPLAEVPIHAQATPNAQTEDLEPEAPWTAAFEPEPQTRPRQAVQRAPEPWLFDVAEGPTSEGRREVPSDQTPVAAVPSSPGLGEARRSAEHGGGDRPGVRLIADQTLRAEELDAHRRPTMASFAAVAVVFLVAGFLAGYGIGSRQPRQAVTTVPATPAATVPVQPPQREWSEAAVESPPPAAPAVVPPSAPPVPAESAEPPAVRAPAGKTPPVAAPRSSPPRATEPRRTPPTPAAGTGTLLADSRPAGARVLLDGRVVGKTPLKLAAVKVGPHTVRLELDGYRPWTTQAVVVGGRDTRIAGSLERAPRR